MVWTAKFIRKDDNVDLIDFIVEFKNGVKVIVAHFLSARGGVEDLKNRVTTRLSELNAPERAQTLPPGSSDFIPATPPPPPPPVPADVTFNEWRRRADNLRIIEELVALNIIPTDHPRVIALRDRVVSDFLAGYVQRLEEE